MADFENQWPVAKYHFRVTIDGEQISFQEASGLQAETTPIEYRNGDSEAFHVIKQAGLIKTSNLVLKKGVFETDSRLLDIFNKIYDKTYYTQDDRIDIIVELLDETASTVMTWNISRAFPVKFSGTDLKSTANEVSIETIEFAYEEIKTEL